MLTEFVILGLKWIYFLGGARGSRWIEVNVSKKAKSSKGVRGQAGQGVQGQPQGPDDGRRERGHAGADGLALGGRH